MLKTLFFDLGNVLVFFSHPRMHQQIADCTGLGRDQVRELLVDEGVQNAYESGRIDSAHFYQTFRSRSSQPFSMRDFLEAASDIFTPNESLFTLIEELKRKDLRLLLLSNTSECHFNRVWTHYPQIRLFDECILSYEVKAMKPSPLIFQKALSKAQCEPKFCFYTDDVSEFVSQARKAGLDSEVFTGVPSLKQALAARHLFLD